MAWNMKVTTFSDKMYAPYTLCGYVHMCTFKADLYTLKMGSFSSFKFFFLGSVHLVLCIIQ